MHFCTGIKAALLLYSQCSRCAGVSRAHSPRRRTWLSTSQMVAVNHQPRGATMRSPELRPCAILHCATAQPHSAALCNPLLQSCTAMIAGSFGPCVRLGFHVVTMSGKADQPKPSLHPSLHFPPLLFVIAVFSADTSTTSLEPEIAGLGIVI